MAIGGGERRAGLRPPHTSKASDPTPCLPSILCDPSHPSFPSPATGSAPGKGNWVGPWVTGLTLCSLFLPPLLAWLPIPLASFPSASARQSRLQSVPSCSLGPWFFGSRLTGAPCCRVGARPQLGLCSWRLWPAGQALGCGSWGHRVPRRSSCCPSACPRWGPIRLRLGGTFPAWPALSWRCCCPRSFPEVAPSPPWLPHPARYPPPRCHGHLVRRRPLAGPGAHRLRPGYVRREGCSPAGPAPGAAAPPTPKPHPSSARPLL